MPDYPYSVFTCLGFLLCIPPAYFNLKIPGRPWATLIFIGWVFTLNLLEFIDSIVWSSNNPAEWWDGKVYCDINSRIKSSFPIGVPGAAIGICRFLADATNPNPSQTDMKHTIFKRNMIDLFLGVLLPLINMALKYIVNPSRYYIVGVNGCGGVTALSWPSIPLYYLWSPVLTFIAACYAIVFLRNWWVRRKILNQNWASGLHNGISRSEFRRLGFTVTTIIVLYFPLSIVVLVDYLKIKRVPFDWKTIHGPLWWIIVKEQHPKASWPLWIGPVLAITSFVFIGTTRNARDFYEGCVEWIYDHLPKKFQVKLAPMQKISERRKNCRAAARTLRGDHHASIVECKTSRKQPVKNWFDSEEELDDSKSVQLSETTLGTPRDEEEGVESSYGLKKTTTAEVTSSRDETPSFSRGVIVTRQVVVETSPR